MKNIDGLDHIGKRVGDFPRSIEFYKAFGFQLLRSDFQEGLTVPVHKQGLTFNRMDSAIKSRTQHKLPTYSAMNGINKTGGAK